MTLAVVPVSEASPTAALSAFVARTRFKDLTADAVVAARRCLRDSLACAIGGSLLEPARIVRDLWAGAGGTAEASVFPDGPRVPAMAAAGANAYAANVLDMDDTLEGHPGACTVMGALAVAEMRNASGRELLGAIVLGYEVATRVGQAIRPSPARADQVYANGTFLGLGAAAAAAALLELDEDQTGQALGLAAMNAIVPGIRKFGTLETGPLTWAKNNYGWAAAGAVQGALLASRGFLGPPTVFDGPRGFWVMAGSDRCDAGVLSRGLGEDHRITQTSFKPYPCCRYLHAALDAFSECRTVAGLEPDQIDRVEVHSSPYTARFFRPHREHPIDAQFDLPYALALVAHDVPPGLAWSAAEVLSDARMLRLAARVVYRPTDEFVGDERYGARVVIVAKGGRWGRTVRYPRGHPRAPLSDTELQAKFEGLVEPVIGRTRTERLSALVDGIVSLQNVRELTRPLLEGDGR